MTRWRWLFDDVGTTGARRISSCRRCATGQPSSMSGRCCWRRRPIETLCTKLGEPVEVCAPTSRAADAFVRGLDDVEVLPKRGLALSCEQFADWADGRSRLLLADCHRDIRRRLGILVVLCSWALQRGYDPAALTSGFHQMLVDGYDWVTAPNAVGMSRHADGGLMATKPHASGGAYISKMSDYCRGCPYDPRMRVGQQACPTTAGYWASLHRNRDRLADNPRLGRALTGLDRLDDLPAVLAHEAARGADPP